MNITSRIWTAGAVASAAAVALVVTGCSENSSTPVSVGKPAAVSTTAPSVASVDGKALEATFTTTCVKQGDLLALALADTSNGTYGNLAVSASITASNTVQAVGIAGSKGGSAGQPYALGYSNGAPGGTAAVTKDGNTYKVTGEATGMPDLANPMAAPKTAKFDITFACSSIVG